MLVADPGILFRWEPGTISTLGGRTFTIARIIVSFPWISVNLGVSTAALFTPNVSDDLVAMILWLEARPQEIAA